MTENPDKLVHTLKNKIIGRIKVEESIEESSRAKRKNRKAEEKHISDTKSSKHGGRKEL